MGRARQISLRRVALVSLVAFAALLVWCIAPWESQATKLQRLERGFLASVARGDTRRVRWALIDGVGPEIESKALREAVSRGQVGMVELLLKWGRPEVNAPGPDGETALSLARQNDNPVLVKLLEGSADSGRQADPLYRRPK